MILTLYTLVRKICKVFILILLSYFNLGQQHYNIGAMEVTSINFEDVLPKVKKSIKEATFITFDCEFTGLNAISNINAFDTIDEYYNKVKKNCKDFLVIQFGLSAFRYDKLESAFKQSTYNFYIFRKPLDRNIPDQRFLCQSSSINFLISQGFDFNKLFKEGIPYLNLEEENQYQQNLVEKHKVISSRATKSTDKIAIPPNDKPFIDDIIKTIQQYLEGGSDEPIQLPKCNPFLRKLIYQTSEDMFTDLVRVETKQLDNKEKVLNVTRVKSSDELKSIEQQKLDEDNKIFQEYIGFTKVLRYIVDSGVLVVGHNLMLDLVHTIDKFLTPLSEDYNEFKECTHALFPQILDTKFMSSREEFKDIINSNVLGHLLDSVKKEPFEIPKCEIEKGCCGYSLEDKKEHEAAFDAFMTGISFLAMWNYLGKDKNLETDEIFSDFNLLKPYINRIHLMRLQDNQFIHFGGVDPKPSRDHVFHISFPKDWKVSDIQQLFSPFGNVFISWINDISAFVGLYKRDQANMAFSCLSNHTSCAVTKYSEYKDRNYVGSDRGLRRKSDESCFKDVKKRKVALENSIDELKIPKAALQKKKSGNTKTFVENEAWD
ncbi:hypothetical protein WA026_001640 [Henosepilachna vigintioctopunctata]|uniref:Poly(A)-specific ribonuclease RNA-binding domain-containing protein n=1 Tax=Henosepilachna vigintioctopunctata TaxID=420089 RepID=A0AAW1URR9_9CUCU